MLAMEIFLNDRKLCLAGIDGTGVANVIVDLPTRIAKEEESDKNTIFDGSAWLNIGGLVTDHANNSSFVRWGEKFQKLSCGDTLVIKLAQTDQIDPPEEVYPDDPDWKAKRREEWKALRQKESNCPPHPPRQWSPARLNSVVSLNDEKLCVAGTGGMGIANITVNLSRTRPKANDRPEDAATMQEEARLKVGGLLEDKSSGKNFVDWVDQPLVCGDAVMLHFTEDEPINPPKKIRPYELEKKKWLSAEEGKG